MHSDRYWSNVGVYYSTTHGVCNLSNGIIRWTVLITISNFVLNFQFWILIFNCSCKYIELAINFVLREIFEKFCVGDLIIKELVCMSNCSNKIQWVDIYST